jgi:hypothetical protein
MSMKKSSDTMGNRTRDLTVCSAVPQPLRHRVPLLKYVLPYKCNRIMISNTFKFSITLKNLAIRWRTLYKATVAVCSEIRTKHSTQSEHHVELLNVKQVGFKRLITLLGDWLRTAEGCIC